MVSQSHMTLDGKSQNSAGATLPLWKQFCWNKPYRGGLTSDPSCSPVKPGRRAQNWAHWPHPSRLAGEDLQPMAAGMAALPSTTEVPGSPLVSEPEQPDLGRFTRKHAFGLHLSDSCFALSTLCKLWWGKEVPFTISEPQHVSGDGLMRHSLVVMRFVHHRVKALCPQKYIACYILSYPSHQGYKSRKRSLKLGHSGRSEQVLASNDMGQLS